MNGRICQRLVLTCTLLLGGARNALASDDNVAVDPPPESGNETAKQSDWKQSDWFGPWQFELAFKGVGGFNGQGGIYGGGLGLSVRHVSKFNAESPVSLNEDFGVLLAIMTLGISAAPKGMWMGNEWGFDVRTRLLQSDKRNATPEQRLVLGIAPSFRITREGSRLRYPAFLPTFIPELGVALRTGYSPEMVIEFHPFSMGFLLTQHVALELESAAMFLVPTDARPVEVWALQSLALELR